MKNKTGKILAISAIIGGSILTLFVGFLILIIAFGSDEEAAKPKEAETKETIVKEEKPKEETAPKEEKKEETKKESTPKEETAPKEEAPKTFNYTVESFTDAINETYTSVGNETILTPLVNEEESAATYIITPRTALLARYDENGMVNEVNAINILEDSTELDSAEFLLSMMVVIATLNPELAKEERGSVLLDDLKLAELLDKGEGSEMTFVGSNLYELTASLTAGGVQLTVLPSGNEF